MISFKTSYLSYFTYRVKALKSKLYHCDAVWRCCIYLKWSDHSKQLRLAIHHHSSTLYRCSAEDSKLKLLYVFILSFAFSIAPTQAKESYAIPEFSQTSATEWFNSKPLNKKDLLGKVTLIDFWTFDCWNCYRSFPWLHGVEKTYRDKGFQIIGIHSPEFEYEKVHSNIKAKIKKFKITNAVMVDNDMSFWRAMNNRYWPSYYLVDKKGQVRANFVGETHKKSSQANKIESLIEKLLAE